MAPNQSLDSDFFPVIFFNEWPQHIMYVLSPVNSEIKIPYQKGKKYESWLSSLQETTRSGLFGTNFKPRFYKVSQEPEKALSKYICMKCFAIHKLKGSVDAYDIFFYFSDNMTLEFLKNVRRVLVRKTTDFSYSYEQEVTQNQ